MVARGERRHIHGRDKVLDAGGEDRGADGVGFPAEEELDGGAADAALARAHAAARLELRFAPSGAAADAAERDVFAAADERVVGGEGFQFGAECEGPFQRGGEAAVALEGGRRAGARFVVAARGGEAGDLAFHDGEIESADARHFAGGVDSVAVCWIIDAAAAEERQQFGIGHEAEAAGQIIAGRSTCRAATAGSPRPVPSTRASSRSHSERPRAAERPAAALPGVARASSPKRVTADGRLLGDQRHDARRASSE